MTKTAGKPQTGTPGSGPSQQDLQTAYQVHTLAQMLYGQLVPAQPWVQPAPFAGTPGMVHPGMAPIAGPWAQGWPMTYGAPFGPGPMGFHWTGPISCFGSEFYPR